MTSGCCRVEGMLAEADCRGEPCRNPTLNPERRPLHMYLANALSGCLARALDQASTFNGVETSASTSEVGGCEVCGTPSRGGRLYSGSGRHTLWVR